MDVEIRVRSVIVVPVGRMEIGDKITIEHHAESFTLVGGSVGGEHILGKLDFVEKELLGCTPYLVAYNCPVKNGVIGVGDGKCYVMSEVGTCDFILLSLTINGSDGIVIGELK